MSEQTPKSEEEIKFRVANTAEALKSPEITHDVVGVDEVEKVMAANEEVITGSEDSTNKREALDKAMGCQDLLSSVGNKEAVIVPGGRGTIRDIYSREGDQIHRVRLSRKDVASVTRTEEAKEGIKRLVFDDGKLKQELTELGLQVREGRNTKNEAKISAAWESLQSEGIASPLSQ